MKIIYQERRQNQEHKHQQPETDFMKEEEGENETLSYSFFCSPLSICYISNSRVMYNNEQQHQCQQEQQQQQQQRYVCLVYYKAMEIRNFQN